MSEVPKLLCPLMSEHGKRVYCCKENCSWYLKFQSFADTQEEGCAILRIALRIISEELQSK
jgi:hypothetical protein